MAVSLVEARKLSQSALQAGVYDVFIQTSPILARLPFKTIRGNSFMYNEEATLPGVAFRAVNTAYQESTGTVNQKSEGLVIMGGDVNVDRFITVTLGNINDQRAYQTQAKVKSLSYSFQDSFINGDTTVDPNSFDGLKKRLVGAQVMDAAANGLPVVGASDTDRHAFLDQLDALIASVAGKPDVLLMNDLILGRIRSSARRLTIYDQTIDDFGRRIDMYNGIPLLDVGTKADGVTRIIPQTETQGTSTAASSIYAVRFGQDVPDGGVTGLQAEDLSVRDLGEAPDMAVYRTRIEWYIGLAVFGGRAAGRLRGVLNS